ncbi:NADPH-dependent F420 reductase [Paenibacillus sepulcri]|uniref:NAD(P)-binding domain-containing protein n=1 Tax=Paenibacillus sepulcri TaxID=359917 RepID=A0ABS7C366_9BACL|nr:NAD(P)-binding domain-containing protein [Paenibacillus sepulcri]
MNIGIIGAGSVGAGIGHGLIRAGHHAAISSRDPQHAKHGAWKQAAGGQGDVVSFNEAARFGELIVMALPWSCAADVLDNIDHSYMKNKTVIDVSNAVEFSSGPRLLYDNTSAGEIMQQMLPESRVVKTLNTVSDKRMVRPAYREGVPVMFMSGNERHAKNQAAFLLNDLGWKDVVDLGDIRQSRLQESIMLACVISEIRLQSPGAAFALLRD